MPILGIMASAMSANLWQPAGAYDSLATVTVGVGGAASVSFTSIPSTYKHLQIRGISRSATAGTGMQEVLFTYNGTTTNYYRLHQVYGDGVSAVAGASAVAVDNAPFFTPTAGTTANVFGAAVIDILDYANTSKNKVLRSLNGFDLNGSGYIIFRSSLWMNTAAISSITLTADSAGTIAQYSSFALYGIK
jgi:hypothetical protein